MKDYKRDRREGDELLRRLLEPQKNSAKSSRQQAVGEIIEGIDRATAYVSRLSGVDLHKPVELEITSGEKDKQMGYDPKNNRYVLFATNTSHFYRGVVVGEKLYATVHPEEYERQYERMASRGRPISEEEWREGLAAKAVAISIGIQWSILEEGKTLEEYAKLSLKGEGFVYDPAQKLAAASQTEFRTFIHKKPKEALEYLNSLTD